ncbi:hypothetical protein V1504DRAFT_471983 [Lipomyces starkeyi]
MNAKSNPAIAIFGATRGCANASLVHSLLAGYDVRTLARTPSKLTSQAHTGLKWETCLIISGLGGKPVLQKSLRRPVTLDNPGICSSSTEALLNALRAAYAENPSTAAIKPLLAYVSTTGITNGPEDVPFGFQFLYHVLLAVPHEDKRKMERTLKSHMAQPEESERLLRGIVGVRICMQHRIPDTTSCYSTASWRGASPFDVE